MHEPRAERDAGQLRRVVQKRKPEPVSEDPVGGQLITGNGTGAGKAVIRRGAQRLAGRRAELVEKTTARTDGTVLASPRMRAMPWSSTSWLLFHGATSGSTSKIIVWTDSSLALPNR